MPVKSVWEWWGGGSGFTGAGNDVGTVDGNDKLWKDRGEQCPSDTLLR